MGSTKPSDGDVKTVQCEMYTMDDNGHSVNHSCETANAGSPASDLRQDVSRHILHYLDKSKH